MTWSASRAGPDQAGTNSGELRRQGRSGAPTQRTMFRRLHRESKAKSVLLPALQEEFIRRFCMRQIAFSGGHAHDHNFEMPESLSRSDYVQWTLPIYSKLMIVEYLGFQLSQRTEPQLARGDYHLGTPLLSSLL